MEEDEWEHLPVRRPGIAARARRRIRVHMTKTEFEGLPIGTMISATWRDGSGRGDYTINRGPDGKNAIFYRTLHVGSFVDAVKLDIIRIAK
jgi:hypothetical protein